MSAVLVTGPTVTQNSPAHKVAVISISLARHQLTLPDHGYGATASRGVPVYASAFANTHEGMVELS